MKEDWLLQETYNRSQLVERLRCSLQCCGPHTWSLQSDWPLLVCSTITTGNIMRVIIATPYISTRQWHCHCFVNTWHCYKCTMRNHRPTSSHTGLINAKWSETDLACQHRNYICFCILQQTTHLVIYVHLSWNRFDIGKSVPSFLGHSSQYTCMYTHNHNKWVQQTE